MKIGQPPDNSLPIQIGNAAATQKAAQGANASTAASTGAVQSTRTAGVAVTVSTLARGLEKTGRGEAADIDTQKVASVRAAIENGTYVVNPEAIADKLLSNAQEMLNRTTR
ncbi:MAG: flagellar biosynthesis anti-sigma factor FlgM [Pseudomonadota bacterium]